jgi:membrane protease YdiL (CAAX protease family)
MEETLRVLVCVGFALLLVMLRLDAPRFGVAEYLDDAVGRPLAVARRRLSWYVLGLAFAGAILFIHPDANGQLGLRAGDAAAALLAGLAAGAVGIVEAAGVALWRYGSLRLPESGAYGWGLLDSVGTALVDEIAFRGVLLGFLLVVGLDPLPAIVVQALVYALATRTGAPGRDPYLLGLALAIGLLGGWLTVATGGIGAAVIGHAITRFAVFAFIGRSEPAWVPADAPRAVVDLPDGEVWPSLGRPEPGAPSR